jgi:ABC-type amino acid transport substrate-binding protein
VRVVVGCLFLVLSMAACAGTSDDWEGIQARGTLRVGMDASFPPFEAVAADGSLMGLDVDLARELGRRLGLEIEFVANLPYDGLYDALAVGRVDVLISSLVVNPDRTDAVSYSTPYFDAGQVLVVGEASPPITGMADLGGRTLAVEFGSRGDEAARSWAAQLDGLTLLPCQTAAEALGLVAAARADAALVDHVSALAAGARRATPGQGGTLTIVGAPVVEEPYAVAVRARNRALLRAVNRALGDMKADGTLDALIARWVARGLAGGIPG